MEAPRTVDVSTIRYSMPTVAADPITFLPVPAGTKGPGFHEDLWCQTEFVAASGLERLKADLAEFQVFEARHRVEHGWTAIYARSRPRSVIVPGADVLATIEGLFGVSRLAPPVLTTSSAVLGQVEGGFALMPSEGVLLHGLVDDRGITALGAILNTDDDMALTRVFTRLNARFGLALVDWRLQFVLVDVGADGMIGIWRPQARTP
ncbi:hypothetical protein KPL74_20825 [Bacillus sp. NP157]|nr:hypothetical protein KPL74_20825 [Bacillus sp. NP157]